MAHLRMPESSLLFTVGLGKASENLNIAIGTYELPERTPAVFDIRPFLSTIMAFSAIHHHGGAGQISNIGNGAIEETKTYCHRKDGLQ